MANHKLWSPEKDEMLITLVKCKPGLYDVESPQYSNFQIKKSTWDEIEKVLEITGAKTRWEQLRAQYRKYLAKQKIKSGQPSAKIWKWRFSEQMKFLNDFMNKDRVPTSPASEQDEDNTQTSDRVEEEILAHHFLSTQYNDNEELESANESVNAFTINTPTTILKNKANAIELQDNASILMKYILQKKVKQDAEHPMEIFFSLMAATVKNFSPVDQYHIKTTVFNLVSKIEEKYLASPPSPVLPPVSSPHRFLASPSSSSNPFNENNQPSLMNISKNCPPFPQLTYTEDRKNTTVQQFNYPRNNRSDYVESTKSQPQQYQEL